MHFYVSTSISDVDVFNKSFIFIKLCFHMSVVEYLQV
jgi:hypothetical protein